MKNQRFLLRLCAGTLLTSLSFVVEANNLALIVSVDAAKLQLRNTLEAIDSCAVGSCHNTNSTHFCDIISALDISVNGAIIGDMMSDKPKISISPRDIVGMKKIFKHCKPTNYQYWLYEGSGTLLHVTYSPDEKGDLETRRYLGLRVVK